MQKHQQWATVLIVQHMTYIHPCQINDPKFVGVRKQRKHIVRARVSREALEPDSWITSLCSGTV